MLQPLCLYKSRGPLSGFCDYTVCHISIMFSNVQVWSYLSMNDLSIPSSWWILNEFGIILVLWFNPLESASSRSLYFLILFIRKDFLLTGKVWKSLYSMSILTSFEGIIALGRSIDRLQSLERSCFLSNFFYLTMLGKLASICYNFVGHTESDFTNKLVKSVWYTVFTRIYWLFDRFYILQGYDL